MIVIFIWNKSFVVVFSFVKMLRFFGNSVVENNGNLCKNILLLSGYYLDCGLCVWNNICWCNVWGRVVLIFLFEECDVLFVLLNNLNLKFIFCSDFLKEENWFEGNFYLELKNFVDLVSREFECLLVVYFLIFGFIVVVVIIWESVL